MINRLTRVSHYALSLMALIVALALSSQIANAQNNNNIITGRVLSAVDNQPLIGATVMVEGTNKGTATDTEGEFLLRGVPKTGNLQISYLGFTTSVVPLTSSTRYQVKLKCDAKKMDEVVVVGYGTMRKKEVTGAVARVDNEQFERVSTSDIGSALQGQIAGVNVQASSGAPGSAANVQIRGISSLDGSNTPLYVIDGVPYDSDPGISANEIESIDVLKDAASAAIYGTRGAAGVILITTKSGNKGAMKISVDAYYGVQKIMSSLNMVDAAESTYLTVAAEGADTGYANAYATYHSKAEYYLYNTNMLNLVEEDYQPIYNFSLNASGGSDKLKYNVMANYFKQDGVIINSGYERFNLRSNTTFKVGEKLSITSNLTAIIDQKENAASSLYKNVFKYDPNGKLFDPDMDIDVTDSDDETVLKSVSTMLAKFKETNVNDGKSISGNFLATYNIIKGLDFMSRLGVGFKLNSDECISPYFEIYDSTGDLYINTTLQSSADVTTTIKSNLSWENMLNYSKNWNDHSLKATAVFSAEKYTTNKTYAYREDLIANDIASLGAATGDMDVDSEEAINTIVGMMARVQYSYDDRYLFSASLRRDGSSRFAEQNRWGYFPSASCGWNISEEKFWRPLKKTINYMKFRVSYGTTGNQNVGDYKSSATITTGYDYAFGSDSSDVLDLGFTQTTYANEDIKWETTQQINFGTDIQMFKSRLSLSLDLYESKKKDMLCTLSVSPTNGSGTSSTVTINVGDMENRGVS